jgi:hypothetical protein
VKTSYFFSEKLKDTDNLVSIAGLTPKEIKIKFPNIKQFDSLKPPKKLVENYKGGVISEKEYTRQYNEILCKLDPKQVYLELKDSIILCWESPKKFCHRHLISKWLNASLGLNIEEL